MFSEEGNPQHIYSILFVLFDSLGLFLFPAENKELADRIQIYSNNSTEYSTNGTRCSMNRLVEEFRLFIEINGEIVEIGLILKKDVLCFERTK